MFNATKNKSSAILGRLNLGMFIVDFLNHVNRHQLRTSNRASHKNGHGFIGISLTFMR